MTTNDRHQYPVVIASDMDYMPPEVAEDIIYMIDSNALYGPTHADGYIGIGTLQLWDRTVSGVADAGDDLLTAINRDFSNMTLEYISIADGLIACHGYHHDGSVDVTYAPVAYEVQEIIEHMSALGKPCGELKRQVVDTYALRFDDDSIVAMSDAATDIIYRSEHAA